MLLPSSPSSFAGFVVRLAVAYVSIYLADQKIDLGPEIWPPAYGSQQSLVLLSSRIGIVQRKIVFLIRKQQCFFKSQKKNQFDFRSVYVSIYNLFARFSLMCVHLHFFKFAHQLMNYLQLVKLLGIFCFHNLWELKITHFCTTGHNYPDIISIRISGQSLKLKIENYCVL